MKRKLHFVTMYLELVFP